MLLLHGYLSNKESFYYQTQFLSVHGFKVTAPDMPGFGASSPLDEAWSVGDYSDWLKDFLKAQKINCPHIIAHSFGARVAIKLLAQGYAADRLIITGGAGIVKQRSPQYYRRVKLYRAVKKVFPKFAERRFGSPEYRTLPPIMKESYKKIVNEDLRSFAKTVKCRTLLIYGRDDTVTPIDEEGKIFNECIEGSELLAIDGGHFCFCEQAEEFNGLCLNFLTEK